MGYRGSELDHYVPITFIGSKAEVIGAFMHDGGKETVLDTQSTKGLDVTRCASSGAVWKKRWTWAKTRIAKARIAKARIAKYS